MVYFAPEPAEAARRIGLRGWWMGYFAGRVAPLGRIPAEAVTAVTFGFAPGMVHRAIPHAWSIADPQLVLQTRLEAVGIALRRVLTPSHVIQLGELGALLWHAVDGCRFGGHPLSAAWAGVDRPDDPLADAWLATTIIREHRGDGHVLAAVVAGLDGLAAYGPPRCTGRRPTRRNRCQQRCRARRSHRPARRRHRHRARAESDGGAETGVRALSTKTTWTEWRGSPVRTSTTAPPAPIETGDWGERGAVDTRTGARRSRTPVTPWR